MRKVTGITTEEKIILSAQTIADKINKINEIVRDTNLNDIERLNKLKKQADVISGKCTECIRLIEYHKLVGENKS